MQLLLILLFSFFGSVSVSDAGERQTYHQIAISFGNQQPLGEELQIAGELGISIIETSQPEILGDPSAESFYFFLKTGPIFPKNHHLQINSEQIISELTEFADRIPENLKHRVAAFGILEYPHEWDPPFRSLGEIIASNTAQETGLTLYYTSLLEHSRYRPAGFSFISSRIPAGFDDPLQSSVSHFIPSGNVKQSLITLEHVIRESMKFEQSVVIIPSDWLLQVVEQNPDIGRVISLYQQGTHISFPLPAKEQQPPALNWDIILLFLLWGSFIVHYRFQPIYGSSLIRYFTNHTFFVQDVMEQRIRNAMPGLYLLLQHALITGLFAYLCSELLFTEIGRLILADSFPSLILFSNFPLSFFITGFLIAVILQTISVLWIYLPNKNMNRISQAINLYSWPLHLNLLIVTFLVVFAQIEVPFTWIIIFCSLFVLIWFFSFNIAAINATKFVSKYRLLYLTGTVGLHVLVISLAVIYLLFTPPVTEAIFFAVTSP